MKTLLYLLFLLLINISSYGHQSRVPHDLKKAVRLLDKDCPDSLKSTINITNDKNLHNISYPWKGSYKTIYNWTSNENQNSPIVLYLDGKGVHNNHIEIILLAFKQHLLGRELNEDSLLKPFRDSEAKQATENKIRFTADTLAGIYVPKDLDDCIRLINIFWPDSVKVEMKNLSGNEYIARLHLGFGTWMRNNWQLWSGSRLSYYFNQMGIYNPEDMTGIILDSYHRVLNGKPIKLEEQIQFYQNYWKKSTEEQDLRKQKEISEYKIGDTVEYKYGFGYANKKQEKAEIKHDRTAQGIVVVVDSQKFLIKVSLLDARCAKGIIYYDNKDFIVLNKDTNRMDHPQKRIVRYMIRKEERWFDYNSWYKI